MQTLQFTATAEDGKIVIVVPEFLNGKEFDVTIHELHSFDENLEHIKKFHEMPVEERMKVLKQFEGKAPYPDVEINKYDVYDQ